jgi:hypothetical protein
MDDGMTLESLRFLVARQSVPAVFSLRRYGEGTAIRFQFRGGGFGKRTQGWLLAEKSKRVRVFARAETAFGVLCGLGIETFNVDLRPVGRTQFPQSVFEVNS